MNAVSIRGDWVGQTIDEKFPLVSWLGGSKTCGVFVSEISRPGDSPNAGASTQRVAVKLMPATAKTEERLALLQRAQSLSHPHLVRIFNYGRSEVEGAPVFYVVTELADEVLSQILPERPLTVDETREMLAPILDALSYLHGEGLVHGHLKPSNVLVVDNEVKLSSDGLLQSGMPAPYSLLNHIHIAPEVASGEVTPAADFWGLGVTLVEALTQQEPVWDSAANQEPEVPGSIPKPFDEIVRACLHVDPARRCSLDDVRAMLAGRSNLAATPRPDTEPPAHLPYHQHRIAETIPAKMPLLPLLVGLVLLVAIIIGLQIHNRKTHTAPIQTEKTIAAPPAEPGPRPSTPVVQPGVSEQGVALNRAIPAPSRGALNTIHGKVTVSVRVNVNPTGAVTNAEFASHGPSAYFARLAMDSSQKWTFKPPTQHGKALASTWLLRYEFRRGGVNATPEQTRP